MPNLSREDMDPGPPNIGPEHSGSTAASVATRAEQIDAAITADAQGDEPLSIDAIKSAIKERADGAAFVLDELRKSRTDFNAFVKRNRAEIEAKIKKAVSELAEAKRIANALTPRKPRTKKAAK